MSSKVHERRGAGEEVVDVRRGGRDVVAGELVRVVGRGGRGGGGAGGEADGGGGLPAVPHVRDAVRGGGAAQVPAVQEPRAAALPPRRRRRRQQQQQHHHHQTAGRHQALATAHILLQSLFCLSL